MTILSAIVCHENYKTLTFNDDIFQNNLYSILHHNGAS